MLKEQLLLTTGERPASVFFRGGEVRIDVHDKWYERAIRRLKADIVALHPDKARNGFRRRKNMCRTVIIATTYRYAQRNLKRWMMEQVQWYATFGLVPPRVIGMARVTTFLYSNGRSSSYYVLPAKPQYRYIAVAKDMKVLKKASGTK